MSLKVSLTKSKKVITQPEQSVTFSGEVQIQRIVDIPSEKLVFAFVEGLGRIQLDDLSGDNYDTPAEWTNADVVAAVKKYLG